MAISSLAYTEGSQKSEKIHGYVFRNSKITGEIKKGGLRNRFRVMAKKLGKIGKNRHFLFSKISKK